MKVEHSQRNHAALANLARSMADASDNNSFKAIFQAMAKGEDSAQAIDDLTERLEALETVTRSENAVKETVRRFRPDGSIEFTEYEGGKIVSRYRKKPHLVPVPDLSRPARPDGSPQIKMEPSLNLFDLLSF